MPDAGTSMHRVQGWAWAAGCRSAQRPAFRASSASHLRCLDMGFREPPAASSFANRSWKDSFREVTRGLMSSCHLQECHLALTFSSEPPRCLLPPPPSLPGKHLLPQNKMTANDKPIKVLSLHMVGSHLLEGEGGFGELLA